MSSLSQLQTKVNRLDAQRRFAWAKYFSTIESQHQQEYNHVIQYQKILEYETPPHVKSEITNLLKELGKNIECPVCCEHISPDNLKILGCGHKLCSGCVSHLEQRRCPTCRKPFQK